ncbi:MAG: c-type cytochrome [Xanthomonadales bacterium]|jgi:cytochrome c5|nr:c-type cytochrome [Xanthomonadales bacterium]
MNCRCISNRRLSIAATAGRLGALILVALSSVVFTGPLSAQDGVVLEAEDAEIVAWRERYLALGKDVFEWACAACHDVGEGAAETGAPQLGNRDNWSDRSPLWSAVLLEHAREGYLEMPAKGGHPYLSDRAVQAAGEYMLGVTFPEKPTD